MRRAICLLMALWLCLPFFAFAEEKALGAEDRINRALLVGCDRFLSQQETTPSSYNNVTRLADALADSTMALETLLTQPEGLSSTGDLAALVLDAFSAADEDDMSLFYLSTHGLWEEGMSSGGVTFLLSDGSRETAVTALQLRSMFDQIQGKKVLIIDACHAGAIMVKGVNTKLQNIFQGEDYIVLCSSGGAEKSWFWSGDINGERLAGAGYFSGALLRGMSAQGGYAADDNRDGEITLNELKRYLLDHHGASTVRTYPEGSDYPIFTYDPALHALSRRQSLIENVSFESDVLTAEDPTLYFSYNVVSPVQVAYQLVYHRGGRWDFDNSSIIYDNNGSFSAWPKPGVTLSLGLKERAITISRDETDSSGYVLVQVLTVQRGVPSVAASRVLCVPPDAGDPELAVSSPAFFAPEDGEELTVLVRHAIPCEITVTIENLEGKTIRRLISRQGTRPEQLAAMGSCFTWDGRDNNGDLAPEGFYRIHVKAYVNDEKYETISEPIILLDVSG